MVRNAIAALIVATLILSSHSYAFDLKDAFFAATVVYQKNTPLSHAQKEALANAQSACASLVDESSCSDLVLAPCLWTTEKCQLDAERFELGLKLDNSINLGKGAVGLGIAALAASFVFGVAGVGLGIACIVVGRYIAKDGPETKARFDETFQSRRKKATLLTSP